MNIKPSVQLDMSLLMIQCTRLWSRSAHCLSGQTEPYSMFFLFVAGCGMMQQIEEYLSDVKVKYDQPAGVFVPV